MSTFGEEYSRSVAYRTLRQPKFLPRQAKDYTQEAFIKRCDYPVSGLKPGEKGDFAYAVHAECHSRPVFGWFPMG